jgi:hypothetical protein
MDRKLIAALTLALAAALATLAACSPAGGAATATPGVAATGGPAASQPVGNGGGSGGGGGAGANPTDPCTLLTQAEVASILGQPVGPGSNADNSHECDFQFPADGMPDVSAGIGFMDGDFDSYCGKPSDSVLQLFIDPVSGVGDGACFTHVGTTQIGSNLTFTKNGRVYSTFALLGPTKTIDNVAAAAKALALAAVARL